MKKYINVSKSTIFKLRIVNQEEIVDYILNNPGKTENQIMEDIYGYYRWYSRESNKKYADCLRRAMGKDLIGRVKAKTNFGRRYIYFVK